MKRQNWTTKEEKRPKTNDISVILPWQLFSSVAKHSNSVFSPASLTAVLTMMASCPGGSPISGKILSFLNSTSLDELNSVFRDISTTVLADGSSIGGPTIKVANGVWVDQSLPIDSSLKDLVVNFFEAAFDQLDFKSKAEEMRKQINSWGLEHTNGLIKDILPPGSVTSDTEWIYGNALYFKGAWENKFYKLMTIDGDFHLLNGTSVSVPFMTSYKDQYIQSCYGFKVLKLPFRQGNDTSRLFSMYFYLPDEKFGLDNLLEEMASTPGFLDYHIPNHSVKVREFRIPKFKIAFGFSVLNAFTSLGLDKNVDLYQKACVEIDEDGAEAAACGAVASCISKKIDFVADHPFLFLIREDETGTVLFAGQMFDPSKSS